MMLFDSNVMSVVLHQVAEKRTTRWQGTTCRMGTERASPVWIAAANGRTDEVKELLARGANVNSTTDNTSCLLAAVRNGHINVVRALVNAGANVNTQGNDGECALGSAGRNGFIHIVNILLGNVGKIETETRDNGGRTALWWAAANGHIDAIEALIAHGADIRAISYSRQSPLDAAVVNGHADAAVKLLHCDPNASYWLPIIVRGIISAMNTFHTFAEDIFSHSSSGSNWVITKILRHYAGGRRDSIYHYFLLMFMTEVFKGQEQEILSLLWQLRTHGVQPYVTKILQQMDMFISRLWPLYTDAQSQVLHNSIINSCDYADASIEMFHAMHGNASLEDVSSYAAVAIDLVPLVSDFTDLIITHAICNNTDCSASPDAHVDRHCNTATHFTTEERLLRSLLENRANVEAENVAGLRPIHTAARTGRVELVQLLLQHGANVDAADIFGNRPLHEAVCHGLDVTKLLVQHRANLNVQNIYGKTPLHIAIERKKCDVIMFLLNQDADVGLTDVWRNTPLHYITSELVEMLTNREFGDLFANQLIQKQAHLKIRNVVSMSALEHIEAHGIHVTISAVYSRQVDCQGNTPLHHAVGVYSQLKMFKVSDNVVKVVDFLVNHGGADINAQNHAGLTPLHVAHGEEAIRACCEYANDQSFTITDKRGRNFWHLLFLLRTDVEVDMESNIWSEIAASSGEFQVDDVNRLPLHYACMRTDAWAKCSGFTKAFVARMNDGLINKQDKFGRTSLHYAAIVGNENLMDLLKTKKADDKIPDTFGITAAEYLTRRDSFKVKSSHLRLISSSNCVARNFRVIPDYVKQYFDNTAGAFSDSAHLDVVIRDLKGRDDRTSYVQKIYDGCRFQYTDTLCRTPESPNEEEDLTATMFADIQSYVQKAMKFLAKEISSEDGRLACEVVPVGSAREGTKIGCCDEFDFNFVLTHLSRICKVSHIRESPPGFVLLKTSTPAFDKDLFDSNGTLNTRVVKFKFEALVKQVLSSLKFCEENGLEFIDPVRSLHSGTVSTYIKLAFTQPVNGYYVPHHVSVDVVPAIQINDWWPDDGRKKDLCQAGECLIVFTQPQNKYRRIGWTEPLGLISFAPAESRLLFEGSLVVKAAYMVVKRMSKYFCHYEFFPSYVIKTALLWCLEEDGFSNCSSSGDSDEIDGAELLRLVQSILRRLLRFAAQDYAPSFFMPKYQKPVWVVEKYLNQYHVLLHLHGLTYKDLFSLKELKSKDQLLQDIKSMFIFSHVMYWTVLSDSDELRLFVPSTINPATTSDIPETEIEYILRRV